MKGEEIKDGETIEGLGVIHPDFENHNIIVDQLLPINKDTVDGACRHGPVTLAKVPPGRLGWLRLARHARTI
jgi:hypothetical protein